ncbi:dual 3',5'-cyclic-AMP and -GMP phosphodiesterase 11A-like [Littorina saxatilis]|uniref:dual 3',5'-cyclic-AMP and -GMP phosphodiesterase 11A-like n=1 Tax=Littorina saxatilis TaxID=31220 RepID=UPI0038B4594E
MILTCPDKLFYSCWQTSFSRIFDLSYPIKNGHARSVGQSRRRRLCRQETANAAVYSSVTTNTNTNNNNNNSPDGKHDKLGNKIAELVLITGETINISDASQDPRFDTEIDKVSGYHTRAILCKPVRNRQFDIIGVAQVVNRVDGQPFDEHDDQLFEAFVIFCGLGISNCQLYEEVSLAAARQAVALEVLSYHTAASSDEVIRLKSQRVPETWEWRLAELNFNDFSLDKDQMMVAAARIFMDLGLIKKLRLDLETVYRWLLTVRRNYRNVAYHNWGHAFNVCQVMFATMMKCNTRKQLTENEIIAMIVGCLCHDLDHRGTNNAFQHKTSSALCQLYGTKATLEHHHFNHAIMILNSEGHNILANLGSEDYADVINLLKHSILATDLSLHIQLREKFFSMVESGQRTWDDRESKEIYRSMLMTASDIAAITKPWDVQRRAADLVVTEFFDQGDKEKHVLKLQPQACMDREKQDEVAKLQMSWIDGICLPLYKSLAKMEPGFRPMMDGVLSNRARWERLDAERLSQHVILETGV